MSEQPSTTTSKRQRRAVLAGLFAVSVGLMTTAGVYAALSGVATGSESVTSGTLNLTLSADVGAGFSQLRRPRWPPATPTTCTST